MDKTILDLIILIIAGCFGGFISGLLGVGGGIIFVPILDYFLIKQGVLSEDIVPYTLANSFFAVLVSGVAGSMPAFRSHSINIRHLLSVGFSAIVAVLVTSYFINHGTWYSPLLFKIVFSVLLLFTLIKTMLHIEGDGNSENMSIGLGVLAGSITGIVSGLSGLGGGIIMIPLFMMFGKMTIKKASALSLAVIPVLSLPNVLYYSIITPSQSIVGSTGYLVWPLIIPLVIGVLMTVKAGVYAAQKISSQTIKFIFAAFIVVTIIRVLSSLL
jgi:uncharacterized membrane protein YfcA